MYRVIIFTFFLLASIRSHAQQEYFIYIESENKQPFYILLSGKTFSSTESGYVILSHLAPSTIDLSIGFPKNAFPEQKFSVTITSKDAGFQLKNLADKGWNLFNFQTLALIPSSTRVDSEKKNTDLIGEKRTDQFSSLLATVVNDSSILYSVKQKPPPPMQNENIALVIKDSALINNRPSPRDSAIAQAAQQQPVLTKTDTQATVKAPQKTLATSSEDVKPGISSMVTDTKKDSVANPSAEITKATPPGNNIPAAVKTDERPQKPETSMVKAAVPPAKPETSSVSKETLVKADTSLSKPETSVAKTVPVEKPEPTEIKKMPVQKPETPAVDRSEPRATSGADLSVKRLSYTQTEAGLNEVYVSGNGEAVDTVRVFIPVITTMAAREKNLAVQKPKTMASPAPNSGATKTAIVKAECKMFASDHEVDKLRVKMMSVSSIDLKIAPVKKLFATRCLSVRQIRSLSELFPDDESRYKFYELAYLHVSDQYNFRGLSETLTNEQSLTAFRELILR